MSLRLDAHIPSGPLAQKWDKHRFEIEEARELYAEKLKKDAEKFIQTFDDYMQKTLAPAYEQQNGVKIVYELTSVGSLPTRVSTAVETGAGPA